MENKVANNKRWTTLSRPVLLKIASFAKALDVGKATRACRDWFRTLSENDSLWQRLFIELWNNDVSAFTLALPSWREKIIARQLILERWVRNRPRTYTLRLPSIQMDRCDLAGGCLISVNAEGKCMAIVDLTRQTPGALTQCTVLNIENNGWQAAAQALLTVDHNTGQARLFSLPDVRERVSKRLGLASNLCDLDAISATKTFSGYPVSRAKEGLTVVDFSGKVLLAEYKGAIAQRDIVADIVSWPHRYMVVRREGKAQELRVENLAAVEAKGELKANAVRVVQLERPIDDRLDFLPECGEGGLLVSRDAASHSTVLVLSMDTGRVLHKIRTTSQDAPKRDGELHHSSDDWPWLAIEQQGWDLRTGRRVCSISQADDSGDVLFNADFLVLTHQGGSGVVVRDFTDGVMEQLVQMRAIRAKILGFDAAGGEQKKAA